ncbi:MAG: class I SAM-dependent methyltransferase [Rhodanobacteraceae bacterium]|nr:MAG: class I SAM-dependent methyltransferase [Rhodanobacteraceae bacterium]
MDTQQANVERFNGVAPEWDSDPRRVLMAQKVARAMRTALNPTGQERALEFGAGTGLVTLLMAPSLAQVTVMDGSAGMLAVLRDKCERKHLTQVEIVEGSVPAQLPGGPFDIIYSSMTLHHVEDVPGLLRALALRLTADGRVALADLDAEDGGFHGADVKGVAHHGFDRATFGKWLRAAGFTDIQFSTAFTVRKERDDGSTHAYPIFLVVARKARA